MQTTTNYSLKKPEETDDVLISDFNDNMDTIDAKLKQINEKTPEVLYGQNRHAVKVTTTETLSSKGAILNAMTFQGINSSNVSTDITSDNLLLLMAVLNIEMCVYNGIVYVNPTKTSFTFAPKTSYASYRVAGEANITSLFNGTELTYMLKSLPNKAYVELPWREAPNIDTAGAAYLTFEYANNSPKVTLTVDLTNTKQPGALIETKNFFPVIPVKGDDTDANNN